MTGRPDEDAREQRRRSDLFRRLHYHEEPRDEHECAPAQVSNESERIVSRRDRGAGNDEERRSERGQPEGDMRIRRSEESGRDEAEAHEHVATALREQLRGRLAGKRAREGASEEEPERDVRDEDRQDARDQKPLEPATERRHSSIEQDEVRGVRYRQHERRRIGHEGTHEQVRQRVDLRYADGGENRGRQHDRGRVVREERGDDDPDAVDRGKEAAARAARPADATDLDLPAIGDEVLTTDETSLNLRAATTRLEIDFIQRALARSGGNRSEAARLLGLARPQLYAKMRDLGLVMPERSGAKE